MVPGLIGKSEMVVQEKDLVSGLGNVDVDVLSTPRLIQLLEAAAIRAIQEFLPSNQLTLGTQVKIKHLSPTPLGMKVTAHALLKEVKQQRLSFIVDAYDEVDKVAEGERECLVVSKDRFLEKVNRKRKK
ncbi:MAG: thioesterase family protein [Thermodesulfobacteriota bacterium]